MTPTLPDDDRFPDALPVVETMRRTPSGRAWLDRLPGIVREIEERWELRLGAPFHGGSCSWVAPATGPGDGSTLSARSGWAVLKVTWPHREADGEAPALRAWNGNGAVRLHRWDREHSALLIERCDPGTTLDDSPLPPAERLTVAAGLLRDLWAAPTPPDEQLEHVGTVCAEWADLLQERMIRLRPGYDPGLVTRGAELLRTLPTTAAREVVVHGDFNPGNVLASKRRPWLAIDPKPMVGDPAYDPWPLLAQIDDPFGHPDPRPVLRERYALVADVLGEDPARLMAWAVARGVECALWCADHDEVEDGAELLAEARVLAELAGL
ncbi:aminoglycoside phosphotransferase family protein [Streptomyces halobius]|uniref:Aminoglycoside phosphotransferase family protein n=1 Tax=Streptomyces halobius TaxID=2879846 RepID=A0ABY4M4H7_9ACTN|nr:aminoglycoside phosphotransferase family protein [Streptomyces halobius]UQA91724.1 aminoglycoside phosphotransferase family protein [Streptomyces halobius]